MEPIPLSVGLILTIVLSVCICTNIINTRKADTTFYKDFNIFLLILSTVCLTINVIRLVYF